MSYCRWRSNKWMNLCNLLVMRGREAANNLGGLAPKTLIRTAYTIQ